ncbi:MAG: cation transporter [Anaerolineaceae bacterium]|nr:cation transporter [Anaerolineaceae bacterium]
MDTTRSTDVRLGLRIEIISLIWMVIEMALSISAGIAAGSILLTAFGIDSLIELVSGGILLWRLRVESRQGDVESVERAEKRAGWLVAITLALLCVYVLVTAVYGLVTQSRPESSILGIGVSAAAVLFMPYLAINKRRIARRIHSDALNGDAANSITCAYMAGTVLIGLALNALFGWWWAENAAALLFLVWLVRETWEAFEEARSAEKD